MTNSELSFRDEDPFVLTLTDEQKEAEVKAYITDMMKAVTGIVPTSETAYMEVTRIYKRAKEWSKAVEDTRKKLNEKPRQEMNYNNDRAKQLSDPLDQIISIANAKTSQYQLMLEEKKREAASKIMEAAALFDVEDQVYIPEVKNTLRGDGALAVVREEKKFRIVDESKIPDRYWMVNEAAIKSDIKLGVREIAGVEIYIEKTTQLRTR